MIEELPKFSFFIPVYNEENRIARCIGSILKQDYPKEKIEILVVDGGSTDKTKEIASQFECVRVFDNPKKLADFGAKISIANATGDLFVIFAADNELSSPDWLLTIAKLFIADNGLCTAWCRLGASSEDPGINKYYALIQNDPLSFFMNKNMQYYQTKGDVRYINGKKCYFFSVDSRRPLVWGANGLVYKTALVREIVIQEGFIADNDVFQTLIENGYNKAAYVPDLIVLHHHVKTLRQWIKKWQRDFGIHFLKYYTSRNMGWAFDADFKRKLTVWILYVIIFPFVIIHSVYLVLRDRNIYWIYHPLASFLQMSTYAFLSLGTASGRAMIRKQFLK